MIHIDVAFDLICPWCLIGKRQLDAALQQFQDRHPGEPVTIMWHAIQLLPNLPEQGVPYLPFYAQRLGSHAAVAARQTQVLAAAEAAGVTIRFDTIRTMPNTAAAIALFNHAAQGHDATIQAALLERLFAAHFLLGENIGERETLAAIASECGLTAGQAAFPPELTRPAPSNEVPAGMGHSGVPHFVFNRRYEVTGAQPSHVLLAHMEAAIAAPVHRQGATS